MHVRPWCALLVLSVFLRLSQEAMVDILSTLHSQRCPQHPQPLGLRLRGGLESEDSPSPVPSISPVLDAMRACTQAAKNGEQDLAGGYAVLQSFKDKGDHVGLEVYHEMLRLCKEAIRECKADTPDAEKILEEAISDGYVPTYKTYELLLGAILEGAKLDPPRGYLSDAFDVLERMQSAGLQPRNETYALYQSVYDEQWPNVVEWDTFDYGWCALTDGEDRLFRGIPELGIPPDPSSDPKYRVHVNDLKDVPLSEDDKRFYARMDRESSTPSLSSTPRSSSF